MPVTRKHLTIHGRVQGVFYRAWSRDEATGLGLKGWVRNRRDGTVEMLIQGDPQAVDQMIRLCRSGPASARVDRIDVAESAEEAPGGFETRPTV
ncbi:acylphosphatase [Sphingosinicella sp. CPCC 101087]|uniref:acylphosphatase n=1 Tax=Sphingosinicella sp. CPCC 101087 TaxID=2497754 RepID=UPI00101B5D3D|nr:acylphosphatase [Sphingosinicella sp. CPCC 101087]